MAGSSAPTPHKTVLTIDVGNTLTRMGLFAGKELVSSWELSTPERLTADEALLATRQVLQEAQVEKPSGCALACVVPALEDIWHEALNRVCAGKTMVVGAGLKTGLPLRCADVASIGADRIADAVAAREALGAPVIVVDVGTATTLGVVDGTGAFVGGVIAPGAALASRALSNAAARLPMVELRVPERVIGRTTREAMQAGLVLGEAARVNGLLALVQEELGCPAPVVVTGENSRLLAPLIHDVALVDKNLSLRGLAHLWHANRR